MLVDSEALEQKNIWLEVREENLKNGLDLYFLDARRKWNLITCEVISELVGKPVSTVERYMSGMESMPVEIYEELMNILNRLEGCY